MIGKLSSALVAGGLTLAALNGTTAYAKPDQLTVYGGPLNTGWYVVAGWLATKLQEDGVKANSELGGAITNVLKISQGPENMGFTFAVSAGMAHAGEQPFPKAVDNFCSLQIFQKSVFHALVAKDAGIESAAGLKGKTYSGQAVGNLSQVALQHFLKANGMTEKDFDLAVGGQQFGADGVKDRRFAGFAAMTAIPSPPIMDAATSVPVDFLSVDDATFAKIKELNAGYSRGEIPPKSYPGLEQAVPTFGTVAIVIMNDASSEDDQYYVTKLIHENWDNLKATSASTKFLTEAEAVETPGVELCPGAAKYWKEVGAL